MNGFKRFYRYSSRISGLLLKKLFLERAVDWLSQKYIDITQLIPFDDCRNLEKFRHKIFNYHTFLGSPFFVNSFTFRISQFLPAIESNFSISLTSKPASIKDSEDFALSNLL